MAVQKRYELAIQRNLAELQRAILNRTTLVGFDKVGGISHLFLKLSYHAFFNDYIAHCIKVFDHNSKSASFWYVHRTNEKPIIEFMRHNKIDVADLECVSKKLKHIRDKTHFHIDTDGVLDTKAVWLEANLSGKELSTAVDAAWAILKNLESLLHLPEVTLPNYGSQTAHLIAIAVEEGRDFDRRSK